MILTLKCGAECLIDDEDWPLVRGRSLSAGKNKNCVYVRSGREYLHRLVMRAERGQMVDHINGNGLDNRKQNLRFVTRQQNSANAHAGKKSSRYFGVSRKKNRFVAQIKVNGRPIHIGYFKEEADAAHAYNKLAKIVYGDQAYINE